ncbi:hypothetical protein MHU86_15785 [Fragilaria crotonensis]|nr:hypothetical protein MHU86_15785 [Fragilaria crotonensis]
MNELDGRMVSTSFRVRPDAVDDRNIEEVIENDETQRPNEPAMPDPVEGEMARPAEVFSATFGSVEGIHSRVNGTGLWSSWQRNFKTPELALLDLFDNAVDATLHDNFIGKIDIYQDVAIHEVDDSQGICMRNNCARRIPDLARVLEVFGSSKDTSQIGENGVGTKQACAALSDLSIVLSKNKEKLSIGFLNKALQMEEGCCIPSFEFHFGSLDRDFDSAFAGSEEFTMSVREYGAGNVQQGRERIFSHIMDLKECEDEYVFLVILHRIIHRGTDGGIEGMLQNMATIIPRNYLHVPPEFHITVGGKRLVFQFWERRLVELHHFPIVIDPSHDFGCAADWHLPNSGNMLNLYLGFDPVRAKMDTKNKASLLIYSRKSGRLVKEVEDARGVLGLISGGTDFGQGLTIILDDNLARLPLTPTKQDLAFGNEPTGKVHESNLFAWVGGFTHFYYQHFLEKYAKSKKALGAEVASHFHTIQALQSGEVHHTLQSGDFSTFHDLSFSRMTVKGKIRCSNKYKCRWIPGEGTRITFRKAAPRGEGKKRASTSKSASAKQRATDEEKHVRKRRKKVEIPDDSESEFEGLSVTGDLEDGNPVIRLENELRLQKIDYERKLAAKEKKIQNLKQGSKALSSAGPNSQDDPSYLNVAALRRKCEALEWELAASRELKAENEKLKKQIAAQKAYMVNLQNLNDSLRNMSNL